MTRSAPAAARTRAKCCPRPRLAPVTIATRPERSNGLAMEVPFTVWDGARPSSGRVRGRRVARTMSALGKRSDGADERGDTDLAVRRSGRSPRNSPAEAQEPSSVSSRVTTVCSGSGTSGVTLPTSETWPPRRTLPMAVAMAGALPTTSRATSAPRPSVISRILAMGSVLF